MDTIDVCEPPRAPLEVQREIQEPKMKLGLMRIRHSWCPGAPCASPEIPPQEFKDVKMKLGLIRIRNS